MVGIPLEEGCAGAAAPAGELGQAGARGRWPSNSWCGSRGTRLSAWWFFVAVRTSLLASLSFYRPFTRALLVKSDGQNSP